MSLRLVTSYLVVEGQIRYLRFTLFCTIQDKKNASAKHWKAELQKLSFMRDLTRFSDYVLAWYSEGPESDFTCYFPSI